MTGLGVFKHDTIRIKGVAGDHRQTVVTIQIQALPVKSVCPLYRNAALAEIRSYGVGLIIADQSPRKVTTDVVALTDIKVAFRLVEASDKQILADSIDMEETQVSRLTKLKPGEAFFFFNKLEAPEEIITPNYRSRFSECCVQCVVPTVDSALGRECRSP